MGTPPAPLDQLRLMFCLVPAVSPNLPRPPYLSTTLRRVSLPSTGPSCSAPGLLGGKKEGAGWWVTPQRGTPRRGTPSHAPAFLLFPPAPHHLAEDGVQLPPHPHMGPPQSPHPSIFGVPAPPLQPPRRPRWLLRPRSLWHGVASVPSVPRGLTLAAGPVAAFWAVRPVGAPFAPRTPHWGRRRHPLGPTGRHRANWYHGSVKHSPVPAPRESRGDTGGGLE